MTKEDRIPKRQFLLLIPFFLVSSYLMFNIPFLLHGGFQCCNCPCPGEQGRLFGNVPQLLPYLGLAAMLNWWIVFFLLLRRFMK